MSIQSRKRAGALLRAAFASVMLAGATLGSPGFAQQQPYVPEAEDPESFPDGPGRDDAFYACAGCHGFRLVANQGLSRERWDETITYMHERHGMPALEGKDRELILDYLAKTFPPKAPQNRGFQNPFLNQ